jgi:hypothetical protein
MSSSYTISGSETFTVTHARYLASKVATDLKRIQRFYGKPSNETIANYEVEITGLLKEGYLGVVTYGFKRDGKWIVPTLKYTAKALSGLVATDDDPGRIRPGANVDGASFGSYLTYSSAWKKLSTEEKEAFKRNPPFERGDSDEPGMSGYLSEDKVYSTGGCALNRATLRSYQ